MPQNGDVEGDDSAPEDYPAEATLERPRGILTKADREYLTGKSDLEPQSHGERRARERIRERVINAFLDFRILERHLEHRDRDRIFSAFDSSQIFPDDTDARLYGMGADEHFGALPDTLAFIYRGIENLEDEPSSSEFELILEHAITRAKNPPDAAIYMPYDVEVTVEKAAREEVDIDTLVERFKSDNIEMLTETEKEAFIRLFAASDAFDPESVRQEFTRRLEMIRDRHETDLQGTIRSSILLSPAYSRERFAGEDEDETDEE